VNHQLPQQQEQQQQLLDSHQEQTASQDTLVYQQQTQQQHTQQQQQQPQKQRRYHQIYCPIPCNNVRTSEELQHQIMFDVDIIEEFGCETPQIKELANQLHINYKFHETLSCRCEGLTEVINRKVQKSVSYSKFSTMSNKNTVYFSYNLLPVYVTSKFPKTKTQKGNIRRHAIQKFCRKFKVSGTYTCICPISQMNRRYLMLLKEDMLPSARENVLIDMYGKLLNVMASGSNTECLPEML
jgi:hypothetical protein